MFSISLLGSVFNPPLSLPFSIIHHRSRSSIVVLGPKAPLSMIVKNSIDRVSCLILKHKHEMLVLHMYASRVLIQIASAVAEETRLLFVTAENRFEALDAHDHLKDYICNLSINPHVTLWLETC
ncbi:hypothetical protein RYX36_006740 [Vicia faba]